MVLQLKRCLNLPTSYFSPSKAGLGKGHAIHQARRRCCGLSGVGPSSVFLSLPHLLSSWGLSWAGLGLG